MKITNEAKELFTKTLEEYGKEISRKAVKSAKEDGRATVMERDIMKWKPYKESELEDDQFIYKVYGHTHYNKLTNIDCWSDYENKAMVLPAKFLNNTLLFRGKLYSNVRSVNEAKRIMESHEKDILDNLMQPHWAYSPYEFRDWEPVEQIDEDTFLLQMWFDDYDGGDEFIEGILFKPSN